MSGQRVSGTGVHVMPKYEHANYDDSFAMDGSSRKQGGGCVKAVFPILFCLVYPLSLFVIP